MWCAASVSLAVFRRGLILATNTDRGADQARRLTELDTWVQQASALGATHVYWG
jgi:hypothetical protein